MPAPIPLPYPYPAYPGSLPREQVQLEIGRIGQGGLGRDRSHVRHSLGGLRPGPRQQSRRRGPRISGTLQPGSRTACSGSQAMAVLFWLNKVLIHQVRLCAGPQPPPASLTSLIPTSKYTAGSKDSPPHTPLPKEEPGLVLPQLETAGDGASAASQRLHTSPPRPRTKGTHIPSGYSQQNNRI